MAFALYDRVQETVSAPGTATLTLNIGAVTGYRRFSAVHTTGDTTYYAMSDGVNWEVGLGTLTTGTSWTLARTTVLASSNAGSAVNFTATTVYVWEDASAAMLMTPTVTTLAATSSILSSGTTGVGYATGAGSTGSQGTSKSTTVAMGKTCVAGTITMNAATLNAATIVTFAVTGIACAATDVVIVNHQSVGTLGAYTIDGYVVSANNVSFSVRNNTAGNLGEAIVLAFAVVKAVAA